MFAFGTKCFAAEDTDDSWTVTIPKTIEFTNDKHPSYDLKVNGRIGDERKMKIVPSSTITMYSNNKDSVTLSINQNNTEFINDDYDNNQDDKRIITDDRDDIDAKGNITGIEGEYIEKENCNVIFSRVIILRTLLRRRYCTKWK